MGKKLYNYEELEAALEDNIVEANRSALIYRLFSEAYTRSPYLTSSRAEPR